MGLSSGNSLASGTAGGGLTEDQVKRIISSNTPYTFISKVTNDGTNNVVEFPLVEANYVDYKILADFDGLSGYMWMQYLNNNAAITQYYRSANPYGRGGSNGYFQQGNGNQLYFGQSDYEHPVNFELDFNIDSNCTNKPLKFFLGATHSSNEGFYTLGGGGCATSTSITGIKFQWSNGNFASGGTFRLYGVNKHA